MPVAMCEPCVAVEHGVFSLWNAVRPSGTVLSYGW